MYLKKRNLLKAMILKPVLQYFFVSCLLLFFTFCLFASYPDFCFILPEIKVNDNELRKKYIAKNIKIVKKKKTKDKKQETKSIL